MLLAEGVAVLVQVVLGVIGIGDVLERIVRSLHVLYHCLEGYIKKVAHPAETLELLLVESLAVLVPAGNHPADGLARVTEALQLADNLVHSLDAS